MNECRPNSNGITIPGSANCSDLSAPISVTKKKLRDVLLLIHKNWIQLINLAGENRSGILKTSLNLNKKS